MNPIYSRYFTFIKPFLKNKVATNYSAVVFSLFTITVFSIFAIKPTLSTIVSLQKSVKEQQDILKQIETKTDSISRAKKNFESLDPQIIQKITSLLPDNTSLPQLLVTISDLTKQQGASISGAQFQPLELTKQTDKLSQNSKIQTLEFSLNVTGSYAKVTSLLNQIINSNRLISIETLNFNKPASGNNLIMSVTAKAYYYK